jgi:hypothetical protein
MSRLREHIKRLAGAQRWTYRAGIESASEPAAWAAVALIACGEVEAAMRPVQWLAGLQQSDGSVGISADEGEPRWPTALAILAWGVVDRATQANRFRTHIESAVAWSLAEHGKSAPRSPQIGHDTTIVGWSWAADTASWLEPTCCFILGLTAAGHGDHPRVEEGRRLVADRLLPDGGANYGNTIVLGQSLLPHLAPTGLAMLALAGEHEGDGRVARSLDYLEQNIGPTTAPASLSWALIGLTAHGRRPSHADQWIESALANPHWQPLAAYEQSLLLLASNPWILGSR